MRAFWRVPKLKLQMYELPRASIYEQEAFCCMFSFFSLISLSFMGPSLIFLCQLEKIKEREGKNEKERQGKGTGRALKRERKAFQIRGNINVSVAHSFAFRTQASFVLKFYCCALRKT